MNDERTTTVVRDLMDAVRGVLVKHEVTYPEYRAAKDYLISVGESGEWPLFADVFFEATVEANEYGDLSGQTTIEGPFFVAGAPAHGTSAQLRDAGDDGDPLHVEARVVDGSGRPLAGAEVEVWHADASGRYSNFHPGVAEWKYRARLTTDDDGRFTLDTIVPPPYEIPKEGPTGRLLLATGWHAFRPAHLHLMIRAEGHLPFTTQLYFAGDPYIDSDVADAVKPELIVELEKRPDAQGGTGFALDYEFALVDAR